MQVAGAAAEGAITFTSWLLTDDTPKNQAFVAQYRKVYGIDLMSFVVYPYVATYLLAEAIENAATTDAHAIRDALRNIKGFQTIVGAVSFDAHGCGIYDPRVAIVKDGTLHPFE